MSFQYLEKLKDQSLQTLSIATENFNKAGNVEDRRKAYLTFVNGLKGLIEYGKAQEDPSLRNTVLTKCSEYTNSAEKMKNQVAYEESNNPNKQAPSNSNQNQYGGNTGYQNNNQPGENKSPKGKAKPLVEGENKEDKEKDKMKETLGEAIVREKPNVKWTDIAGLEKAKGSLQEAVILPMKFPDIFVGQRKPWKGILLYGPPGTGKTYLAKAVATECQGTFFSVSSSDLISKWVGESEKLIKTLFQLARESSPSVIFIDELDSIAGSRTDGENESTRRVKTEFLVQMQGVGHDDKNLLVLGATNLPWALDPAVRRRFEKRIYIPLPDEPARLAMLKIMIKDTPNTLDEHHLKIVAELAKGFSGSDISTLVKEACYQPLRKCESAVAYKLVIDPKDGLEKYTPCPPSDPASKKMRLHEIPGSKLYLPKISVDDLMEAMNKSKPSVSEGDLGRYIQFTEEFGQEG